MSNSRKVIVFGATGAVGGAAALEAHKRGAEVHLAMRNTSKPTPDLPSHLNKVQADLTDAASVERAVKETGATAAFIYISFEGDNDAVAQALKNSGIEHAVLLSSFSMYLDSTEEKGAIYYAHAKVEEALTKAGLVSTFIRPMYFTSNIWQWKSAIQAGEIPVTSPQYHDDYIAPEDIGAVAGVKLLTNEPEIIPLCGPKLINKTDAWAIVGEGLGKTLKTNEVSADEYQAMLEKNGLPGVIAKELTGYACMDDEQKFKGLYEEASKNVKKYLGREAITLREWVSKHKQEAE